MGRTWLLRGSAAAIFGLLVGAWAVGLAGADEAASPVDKLSIPASPDSSSVPVSERSTDRESGKFRRTRALRPSPDGLTEPSQDVADDPASDDPATPDPTSPDPSPTPQGPSQPPDSPPPPPPSNSPNQPDDECTDLGSTVDCALDPFTGGP